MNASFHRFTPRELLLGVAHPQDEPESRPTGMYRTGCGMFDTFLDNFYRHGIRSVRFHADLLGLTNHELCTDIRVHTGMNYPDFSKELVYLMARDMLASGKWAKMEDVARRLGISYSGFYKLLMAREKRTPTGVRWRENR